MNWLEGDTNKKLKRKENKTKNHGASNQTKSITKRLHNFKMAAMAAYNFWREKHKMEDVKMDSCLLPEIKHWTMEWKNHQLIQIQDSIYIFCYIVMTRQYKLHKMKDTNRDDF